MFEEAEAIRNMMLMCGISQSEMAKRLDVSQSFVANKLRLLRLCECEREKIINSPLTERHARALLRIRDSQKRGEALDCVIERGLTVRETEALADWLHADELSKEVCRLSRAERIEGFNKALAECLAGLRGAGVNAHKTVGYHGRKTYITIAIDEA